MNKEMAEEIIINLEDYQSQKNPKGIEYAFINQQIAALESYDPEAIAEKFIIEFKKFYNIDELSEDCIKKTFIKVLEEA